MAYYSASVSYQLLGSMCSAFRDAFLCTKVLKIIYLICCCFTISLNMSLYSIPLYWNIKSFPPNKLPLNGISFSFFFTIFLSLPLVHENLIRSVFFEIVNSLGAHQRRCRETFTFNLLSHISAWNEIQLTAIFIWLYPLNLPHDYRLEIWVKIASVHRNLNMWSVSVYLSPAYIYIYLLLQGEAWSWYRHWKLTF